MAIPKCLGAPLCRFCSRVCLVCSPASVLNANVLGKTDLRRLPDSPKRGRWRGSDSVRARGIPAHRHSGGPASGGGGIRTHERPKGRQRFSRSCVTVPDFLARRRRARCMVFDVPRRASARHRERFRQRGTASRPAGLAGPSASHPPPRTNHGPTGLFDSTLPQRFHKYRSDSSLRHAWSRFRSTKPSPRPDSNRRPLPYHGASAGLGGSAESGGRRRFPWKWRFWWVRAGLGRTRWSRSMLGEMLGDGLAQPLERLPPGALEGQRLSGTIASTKSDHEPRRRQPDRLAPIGVVRGAGLS